MLLLRLLEPLADHADGVTALSVLDSSTEAEITLVPHLDREAAEAAAEAARAAFGPRSLAKARGIA